MKVRSLFTKRWLLLISIPLTLLAILYLIVIYFFGYALAGGFSPHSAESTLYIHKHENGIRSILTTTMDAAEKCQESTQVCEKLNQTAIYDVLGDTSSVSYFPSTYFIRLKDQHIQKLFLSGKMINEKITTPREARVYAFIARGKGTQIFCPNSGNYTRPLRIDLSCLRDFPSDAGTENIILVRDDNQQVIGAVVKIYGS
jgi:hypothetical protein